MNLRQGKRKIPIPSLSLSQQLSSTFIRFLMKEELNNIFLCFDSWVQINHILRSKVNGIRIKKVFVIIMSVLLLFEFSFLLQMFTMYAIIFSRKHLNEF